MIFLDTNILLYAGSNAVADAEKKRIAVDLIAFEEIAISTQVVQEFIANALRKKELGFDAARIGKALEAFERIIVLPITLALAREAWSIHTRFGVSQWDASIIAAARELGCHTLYTEDLNHGQDYAGVRVLNPFRSA